MDIELKNALQHKDDDVRLVIPEEIEAALSNLPRSS
jgi:hypothetical protein